MLDLSKALISLWHRFRVDSKHNSNGSIRMVAMRLILDPSRDSRYPWGELYDVLGGLSGNICCCVDQSRVVRHSRRPGLKR